MIEFARLTSQDDKTEKAPGSHPRALCVRPGTSKQGEQSTNREEQYPMDTSTSTDSCGIVPQKLAYCACCHEFGQVTTHWDHPTINLCEACRHVLFVLEAHGSISHAAYAFFNRLAAGDLR